MTYMLPALQPEPLLCLSGNVQVLLAEPAIPIRDSMVVGSKAHLCPSLWQTLRGWPAWGPTSKELQDVMRKI